MPKRPAQSRGDAAHAPPEGAAATEPHGATTQPDPWAGLPMPALTHPDPPYAEPAES
jgi:hypothetical protein